MKALHAFSLFLSGCCNAMEHLTYMVVKNVATNMKAILLKLPYRLREKWRDSACQIQKTHGRRPKFPDLVDFLEWQVEIMSDPLFGNIQDARPLATVKSYTFPKTKDQNQREAVLQ